MYPLLPQYNIRSGSSLDRALLVKFMQRTYQEMFPEYDFSHLAQTVEQYLSQETPLWWVDFLETRDAPLDASIPSPVACLWMGNAIDQLGGDRHAIVFLVYVAKEHRRQGIGTNLMEYAQRWAKKRGDRQIGLQVFQSNLPALNLYNQLGYKTQSFWMIKSL